MEIFDSIGERLRQQREELGLSQSDIARIVASAGVAGATRQSQSMYEKGKRAPDAAYLTVIASAGVDIGYVLTGSRTPEETLKNMRLAAQVTVTAKMPPSEREAMDERYVDMAIAAHAAHYVAETAARYDATPRLRDDQAALLDAYEHCSPDARAAALKLLASAAQSQSDTPAPTPRKRSRKAG